MPRPGRRRKRSPVEHHPRRRAGPISRGRRWVPPPPGISPRRTSGSAKLASGVGDPDVAGERHLEPAAQTVTVDRRDDGNRQLLDQLGERLDPDRWLAVACDRLQVCPGREGLLPLPAHHDDVVFGPDPFELRRDGGGNSAVIAFTGGLSSQIVVTPSTDGHSSDEPRAPPPPPRRGRNAGVGPASTPFGTRISAKQIPASA